MNIRHFLTAAIMGLLAVSAPAAEYTNTSRSFQLGYGGTGKDFVIAGEADLRVFNAGGTNDTIVVIDIPSNTLLEALQYQVTVTNGNALTFDIGDSNSTTQFIAAASGNTKVPAVSANNAATRRYYTANDAVKVNLLTGVPTGAVIKVRAKLIDFRQ